jgi:23S rRNA (cytosine1962-C5)-methyltransferase
MATAVLRGGGQRRLLQGHPWIYQSDIHTVRGSPEPGEVVKILAANRQFLGRGTYNARSQIALRVLTTEDEAVDGAFLMGRIAAASARRGARGGPDAAYRVVFSEGDLLPGLIVDRYGPVAVAQFLTAGMERLRGPILEAIEGVLEPRGIYLRNDASVRSLEGLPLERGWAQGEGPEQVEVREGPCRFRVDVGRGQKTGFFLDQQENRLAAREVAAGREVLDCFCYTGAFAVHLAQAGARLVEGVDISPEAVAGAEENARLNGVEGRCRFRTANAFDDLRLLDKTRRKFDCVILDPPAFTKGKETVGGALRGYKEINLRAMRLLRPGGILITCSCSYHIDEATFLTMLEEAAADAHCRMRVLAVRRQAADHPILLGVRETRYLKCVFLERL